MWPVIGSLEQKLARYIHGLLPIFLGTFDVDV